MSALGELIAAGRRRAKLSQRELGGLLTTPEKPEGVWGTYIGQVERGKRVPPDSLLLSMSAALQLDPVRVLAAAYQSRSHTDTGRLVFSLAPLLLFLSGEGNEASPDIQTALRSLGQLTAAMREEKHPRLRETLGRVAQLDDQRWHLFRNAVAAISAAAPLESVRDS